MDLDRIKRNVKKMAEQGAPISDIDGYIEAEGATVDQIKNHKPKSTLQQFGEGALNALQYVTGTQSDPKFEGVGTFEDTRESALLRKPAPGFEPGMFGENDKQNPVGIKAKVLGQTDDMYADIIEQQLKEQGQFVKREKDRNGYDVFTYKGADGKEYQAYANHPGWEQADIERFGFASLPFMGGGAAVNAAVRGAPVAVRAGAQALGAGATDLAVSGAASTQGSDITADQALMKAGFSALGGGAGEIAGHVLTRWLDKARAAKYVDENGKLTAGGKAQARSAGLDPDKVDENLAAQMKENLEGAADIGEAQTKTQLDEFGLKATEGARSRNTQQISEEFAARKGAYGEEAQRTIDQFDKEAKEALGEAVTTKIGRQFDGKGPGDAPVSMSKENLGNELRTGLRAAKDATRETDKELWEGVGKLLPKEEGLNLLRNNMQKELGGEMINIDNPRYVRTNEALDLIDKYARGDKVSKSHPVLGQTDEGISDMGQVREELLDIYKAAERGSKDARTAKKVYDAYNNWIDEVAEKGLLQEGSRIQALNLIEARRFHRETMQLFQPSDKMGKKTPAARILDKIIEDGKTPEEIINGMFGKAGELGTPVSGASQALKHILKIAKQFGQSGDEIARLPQSLRTAYWARIVKNNKGEIASPQIIANNLDSAFNNQMSVMKQLYDKDEIAMLRRFRTALQKTIVKDPNPSGTAAAIKALARKDNESGGAVKQVIAAQGQRERFVKGNILLGNIYRWLAKKTPKHIFGTSTKDAVGARFGRQAVSQKVRKRNPASLGGAGAYTGSRAGADE